MKKCQAYIKIGIGCLLLTISLAACDGGVPGGAEGLVPEGVERAPIEEEAPPYALPIYPDPGLDPDPIHEDVSLTWEWNEEAIDGYRIYYATISFYDKPIVINIIDVGYDNHHTIFNLNSLQTWFFVCTAYRGSPEGDHFEESEYSNEVVW